MLLPTRTDKLRASRAVYTALIWSRTLRLHVAQLKVPFAVEANMDLKALQVYPSLSTAQFPGLSLL